MLRKDSIQFEADIINTYASEYTDDATLYKHIRHVYDADEESIYGYRGELRGQGWDSSYNIYEWLVIDFDYNRRDNETIIKLCSRTNNELMLQDSGLAAHYFTTVIDNVLPL